MIDDRFSLVPHPDFKNLFFLQFTVVLTQEKYFTTQTGKIQDECKRQYPELDFNTIGEYSARFAEGQYARCIQCKSKNAYAEELVFSLPLGLDTIMSAICNFKKAIPSTQFTVNPAELSTITPYKYV